MEMSGPYVEITGSFNYRYYADGEQIADMQTDAKIKNLMDTTIEKGMITLELTSLTSFATEQALVPF
jgi:riboflavin synthase alpha subunit